MKNKIMEAFVYLWQDARQKPYGYYLGYHKGHPDDGYTHSSKVFESFNKNNIPDGVRRRILATGTSEEMMELENKLLKNRKDSKWDRYYNITVSFPPYMWEDPDFRAMQSEKMTKQVTKQWEDPSYREMMSKQVTKQWEDPSYREMMSKQATKQWENPEFRNNQSERATKQWEDPEYREMMSEKMTKQITKQWEDPEYREMMSEKVACNVCGFITNKQNIARWHNDNCKHKK